MAPFEPLSAGVDNLQIIDPVLSNIAVQYRPHGFVYAKIVNSFPVASVHTRTTMSARTGCT